MSFNGNQYTSDAGFDLDTKAIKREYRQFQLALHPDKHVQDNEQFQDNVLKIQQQQ